MTAVSMKELLEAGVHFGHQKKRWNPKMKPFIFGQRNGIYIIDLQQTVHRAARALEFVADMASRGGSVLFVGTKRQAQETVAEEAQRCGMPFVNVRWLGGTLTNFATIKRRIERLRYLESLETDAHRREMLTKKELGRLEKERVKLEKVLSGIKSMATLPEAVFVVDPKNEHIAVMEARRLKIPVVAVVDTNCDPDEIDFLIPGNDDAIRSIRLFSSRVAEAVLEGQAMHARSAEAPAPGEGETGGEPENASSDAAEESKTSSGGRSRGKGRSRSSSSGGSSSSEGSRAPEGTVPAEIA